MCMDKMSGFRGWLDSYGYIPISSVFAWLAWKFFDLPHNLVAGVFLTAMFLSISFLRYRLRKVDNGRFRFGLLMGIGLFILTVAKYVDLRIYDFFSPGPIWVLVAALPAFAAHYIYPPIDLNTDQENT